MGDKATIDWERIELDYRAGVKSLREIAAAHGITEGAIRKRAKKPGEEWVRDLAGKIKAQADNLVRKQAVRSSVRANQVESEKMVVEANAQAIANIQISHRTDIARSRALAMRLLAELEFDTENTDLLDQLTEALNSEDGSAARIKALQRATSTSGRVDSLKKLADALRVLVSMEREAYSMDTLEPPAVQVQATFDYSKLSPAALRELREAAADAAT